MYNVKLLNKISKYGLEKLDTSKYAYGEDVESPVAIMVRSAAMHDMEFDENLLCIARAGAGVNNIPVDACADKGIVVFNTPGANANGVKELTIAALLLASRDIYGGIKWASSLDNPENGVAKAVEKGKSQFAGCELKGKTLGVAGLGAIGAMVANVALCLDMNVIGYDPYLNENSKKRLNDGVQICDSYDDMFAKADYITMHIPSTPQTKGMFCADAFAKMKDGVKILNLSRADLVNADDIKAAIKSGKVSKYVTDFPTEETINVEGIVTIPHLGASTEESEDNCAMMAANELTNYIENGTITNSVNYPNLALDKSGASRVCVLFKNTDGTYDSVAGALSDVANSAKAEKGNYGYAIFDLNTNAGDDTADKIKALNDVIRVRII